jgi:hypothetical protein
MNCNDLKEKNLVTASMAEIFLIFTRFVRETLHTTRVNPFSTRFFLLIILSKYGNTKKNETLFYKDRDDDADVAGAKVDTFSPNMIVNFIYIIPLARQRTISGALYATMIDAK